MNDVFEGMSINQWIKLLRVRSPREQCAAALALAELGPHAEPAKSALLAALKDPEPCVQAAVQIAIDVVYIAPENRRKMFEHLQNDDEEMQQRILDSLHELAFSSLLGTASAPEKEPVASAIRIANLPPSSTQDLTDSGEREYAPDIAHVHSLPWPFVLGGIALLLSLGFCFAGCGG